MAHIAFLMRHATPDWTRTDIRYDIPPGPPLTQVGKNEAHAAAQFLRDKGITQIVASPLERCKDTAGIIAAELSLPITIVDDIAEWRAGEDEDGVMQRSRAYWDTLWLDGQTGGKGHTGGEARPLIVTHGGPSRLLLQSLGLVEAEMEHFRAQFDHDNPMPPAGIWRIERAAHGNAWQMDMVFTPEPHRPFQRA